MIDIVVGSQHRQYDPGVRVQVPVDIEVGLWAESGRAEHVPPPTGLCWEFDAHVIGHDVDDEAQTAGPGRRGEAGQTLGPAEFRRTVVGSVTS